MKGVYSPGLTKDKKKAVRKTAQIISIEEGDMYNIKRDRNIVGFSEKYIG